MKLALSGDRVFLDVTEPRPHVLTVAVSRHRVHAVSVQFLFDCHELWRVRCCLVMGSCFIAVYIRKFTIVTALLLLWLEAMIKQGCCICAVCFRSELWNFFQGWSLLLLSVCLASDSILLVLWWLKLHWNGLLSCANSFLWALDLSIEVFSFLWNLRWWGSCAFLIFASFFSLSDSAFREDNIDR